MKLTSMIGDLLKSLFQKPVTQQYPFERLPAPERFRGNLHWEPEKCTGCMLCIKDCPANAIELIVIDKINKRFVMRYHQDRCIYCEQCVVSCRFKCLNLSNQEWEQAVTQRKPLEVFYGNDEDIQSLLARTAAQPAESPCK
ncbi:MAG: 4Fe-4S binding protein [Bellilinea sp.]